MKIASQTINTENSTINVDTTDLPYGEHNIKAKFVPSEGKLGTSTSKNSKLRIYEATHIEYTILNNNGGTAEILVYLYDSNNNDIGAVIDVYQDGEVVPGVSSGGRVYLHGEIGTTHTIQLSTDTKIVNSHIYAPATVEFELEFKQESTETVEIDTTDLTQFITWAGGNTQTNYSVDGHISNQMGSCTTCKQTLQRDMTIHAEYDATSNITVSRAWIGLLQRQRPGLSELQNLFIEQLELRRFTERHDGTDAVIGTNLPDHTEKMIIDITIDENGYITYQNELGNTYVSTEAFTDSELETMEFGWQDFDSKGLYLKKLVYTYTP